MLIRILIISRDILYITPLVQCIDELNYESSELITNEILQRLVSLKVFCLTTIAYKICKFMQIINKIFVIEREKG